jgi:hypothetical protein
MRIAETRGVRHSQPVRVSSKDQVRAALIFVADLNLQKPRSSRSGSSKLQLIVFLGLPGSARTATRARKIRRTNTVDIHVLSFCLL